MYNSWVNLNHHWQSLLYKEWLLFIKERFPLSTFLWDDSYGLDFLLCKALNLETSKPEDDVQNLNSIIKDELVSLQESTINDIFDMEFLALDSSITYLSPLKDFKKSSNPQPIGFSGILLAKRQNSFYCTYFLHNRNVADTKSPYPIKRLEVIRWFNQKSMVFNQSLS